MNLELYLNGCPLKLRKNPPKQYISWWYYHMARICFIIFVNSYIPRDHIESYTSDSSRYKS